MNRLLLSITIFILLFHNNNIKSQWVLLDRLDTIGHVSEIAIKDNFQFAATTASAAWRSSDNGINWVLIDNGLSNAYTTSFAFNSHGMFTSTGNGVFYSSNNGDSWSIASSGLTGGVRKIVSRNDFLYAGHLVAVFIKLQTTEATGFGLHWGKVTNYLLYTAHKMNFISALLIQF